MRFSPAVLIAAPQIAHDLAHLDDIARRELLEVGLVPAGPVRGLFGEGCTEHLEDAVETLFADDVADADEVDILGGHLDDQVSLGDVELQVFLGLALDDPVFDLDDRRGPVVGVDDRFANLKKHGVMSFRQPPGYHRRRCGKVRRPPLAPDCADSRRTPRMLEMSSSVPGGSVKSRLIASLALGALVVLGTTGCAMLSTQATSIQYSASDGVNIPDSGPLQVRNVLIVSDEEGVDGVLVAAIVNATSETHTLTIEYGEGSKTTETIRVPANSTVSLGTEETEPLPLEGIDTKPGANLPMFFQSGDSDGVLFDVPVLDGALDYYGDLLP
jgi:hypothetical protein